MMKQYYEGIEWYDYLVFLVYNGIFTYLLYRLGDVFYDLQKKTVVTFILLFQFYFFIVVGNIFFDFLPGVNDSGFYAFMVSSGQYPQESPENIIVIYYLTLIIGLVCLNSPVIFTFFCIFIFINALMYFLKAWKKYYPLQNIKGEYIFSILCFLWPAGILYATAPLREPFIIFGFALFFSGLLHFIHKKTWGQLIFGSLVLCSFWFQLLAFVIPVLLVLFVNSLKVIKVAKAGIITLCIIVGLILIRYVLLEVPLSPESFSHYRNLNVEQGGEFTYGMVNWQSYVEMISDYFFLILQFLFSPIPIFIHHNPFRHILHFLDFVFILFLLIVLLLNFRKVFSGKTDLIALLLFYIILFGTYEYHLLDAVRHRMPLEVVFMLLIVNPLSKIVFPKTNQGLNSLESS